MQTEPQSEALHVPIRQEKLHLWNMWPFSQRIKNRGLSNREHTRQSERPTQKSYMYNYGKFLNFFRISDNIRSISPTNTIDFWVMLCLFEESLKISGSYISKLFRFRKLINNDAKIVSLLFANSIIYSHILVKLGEIWDSYHVI